MAALLLSSPPAFLLVLGGGLALVGLLALVGVAAARTRRGDAALARLRHSWDEAAWRASDTWADFSEWVRTGR
jgi:hypothetical protein